MWTCDLHRVFLRLTDDQSKYFSTVESTILEISLVDEIARLPTALDSTGAFENASITFD
jgi:hypothetical protein